MGPVYAEIEIDAPPESIYEYLLDLATRPVLFDRAISDFRLLRLESSGVGAGARFRFRRRKAWADTTITAAEPGRRVSERGATGRFNRNRTGTEWEITETASGVARVRLTYWTEPTGLSKLFDRLTGSAGWYGRQLGHAVNRLRERVEAEQTEAGRIPVAGGNRYATGVL
jgi:uncharacterized membrane protein